MAKTPPIVKDGLLTYPQGGSSAQVEVDSADWYTWLETASSFVFRSEHASFTARKDRAGNRRGSLYWRAYCTREGKLQRVYLGKSEELTFERLVAVATALAGQGHDGDALDAETAAAPSSRASLSQGTRPTSEQAAELPPPFPRGAFSRTRAALPTYLTSLIGREQEVQAVSALLSRPEVRLLTLTGTPGVGKTRLSLQVASELSSTFAEGVFLVSLAPISDPQQVVHSILQTLSISDSSSQTPLARLTSSLQNKHLLLLLDNFEQVIEAAVVVAELVATCPKLTLLVTSREVLRLQAEHEFVVPPLALPNLKRLPNLATLAQYEAVALFLVRAQAAKPDFTLTAANATAVAALCARLDGLPLAIELAAARIKYFPPQVLLTRLEQGLSVLSGGARDLPARQQTLRGALAWSYELLTTEEQQLFRRLAAFVDGCTWQAAEQVGTAAGPLHIDILEGLVSLVDKSLLRQEPAHEGAGAEPRFAMLQTLREFGLEMLATVGETQVTREAHAAYYLPLAEEAEPHLHGAEQATWLARLVQEHKNLRAALAFLLHQAPEGAGSQASKQQALRLCVALMPFWFIYGYYREGLAFLQQALAMGASLAGALRAKALLAAAELTFLLDDLQQTETLCTESLALFRELGDKAGMADALWWLGSNAWAKSQFSVARPQLEEAAAFYQELGDHWKRGRCLTQLSRVDTAQGEYNRAQGLLKESLTLYRTLGDKGRLSWVIYLQARLLFLSGRDLAQARNLTEQSLALVRELDASVHRAYPLVLLGQLTLQQGEQARARALFEESLAILKEIGDRAGMADALMGLAWVARLQGDLATAHLLYQESLVHSNEADYKEGIAPALEGLAVVEAQQGKLAQAARLWGAAEALRKSIGAPIPPVERAAYEQAVEEARLQAKKEAFASAWAEGRIMSLEQVLANGEAMPSPRPVPTASPSPATAFAPPLHARLTPRELDVLCLLAQGLTSAQIAEQLVLGVVTVNFHVRSIYSKLGVSSRSTATRYAIEHHLV